MSASGLSNRGKIARKLMALVLASLLTSFVVTAGISTWLDLQRQASLETNRLTQTARVIASMSSDAVARQNRTEAFTVVRSIGQMPNVSYARLVSGRAGLLAETGGGSRLVNDADMGVHDGLSLWSVLKTRSIQVSAPVLADGRTVGWVTLFSETPELRSRVLATIWTTLAGALVAVVAGLIVAMQMARRISRPIVQLAGIVTDVHETQDFSIKLDIRADGEVADLVAGFDTMLAGVRERDARIAAHVEHLEDEVTARTAELVVAKDAAEQANAAKSDFLAVMSHEIRTPLNGILALGEMLAKSDLPQRQQRYAQVISKSGQSLLSIINDILDFSKVEAGKMELEREPLDLAEIAEDVASLFSEKATSKDLDLAVFVDPRLPAILGDPVRLRQVIGNLVNNAIKFTEVGGVIISITPGVPGEGELRVSVRDTGPGIPEDKLPTLFDAFTQADQSTTRKYGGTGLGLAICDRLVRSMGGRWALSSTVGAGSTFAFDLPFEAAATTASVAPMALSLALNGLSAQTEQILHDYADALGLRIEGDASAAMVGPGEPPPPLGAVVCRDEAEAEQVHKRHPDACVLVRPLRRAEILEVFRALADGRQPKIVQTEATTRSAVTFPGVRVLVVDDSEVNREVAAEALARLGVETMTCDDGQQAIERLRSHRFDMVLMDGSMPVLDGFEAARRIRREEEDTGRPRAIIVALTAHVVGAGADAWRSSGMDGVVHKPFTLDDLERVLLRFCSDRSVRDATPPLTEVPLPSSDDSLFDPVVRGELAAMAGQGRAAFVDKVQGLYAANAPVKVRDVIAAATAGDHDGLARAAHALKSMSLSLGASAVAREASRIETSAREANPGGIEVGGLEALVSRTIQAMSLGPEPTPRPLTPAEELDEALQRGDLHLVYQPLMDRSGLFAGKVEALVRWTHPHHGRLRPDAFIPRLEQEGGIERLTDFVLERAMEDLTGRDDIRVSVNASAGEFQRADFPARVLRAISRAGFDADRLEVEVTETAMLDVEAARRSVDALREAGIGVALDDFGAGYTSLHALRELKFTTLKVDRSFVERCVSDSASASIVHAVVGVGRALGMKVVCEGVETAEQAAFLKVAGAHLLQGYHFSRPVELSALPDRADAAA